MRDQDNAAQDGDQGAGETDEQRIARETAEAEAERQAQVQREADDAQAQDAAPADQPDEPDGSLIEVAEAAAAAPTLHRADELADQEA